MSETVDLKMRVQTIMSSPVITARVDENVVEVAKTMDIHDVGSVVVTDREGRPLGIITDMDIIKRVIAKNLNPNEVKAGEVMSQPLITIDPTATITDAAKLMSRYGVKRLAVMYKGRLVGIVSSKDITMIMPELIEIIYEKARIEGATVTPGYAQTAVGYCEICGQWSDMLRFRNGKFLCGDCWEETEK